jgi:hypothetical protein
MVTGLAVAGETIFEARFVNKDWLNAFNSIQRPPWTQGIERAIPREDDELGRCALEVLYPMGKYGNDKTGVQWITYLGKSYDHLKLSYSIKFGKHFDFVLGGKLPGLIGGHVAGHPHSTVTGGMRSDGKNGWSARMMWRKGGKIVQYVYHPDQEGKWGDDLEWGIDGRPAFFQTGKWYRVSTEIKMNTPKKKDGTIRSWLNDELALEKTNIRFRDNSTFAIDALYFSTFFGGDDETWSTTKDERVYFADFKIEIP